MLSPRSLFQIDRKLVEGEHVDSQFNELLTSTQGSQLAYSLLTLPVKFFSCWGFICSFFASVRCSGGQVMCVILKLKGASRVRGYTLIKNYYVNGFLLSALSTGNPDTLCPCFTFRLPRISFYIENTLNARITVSPLAIAFDMSCFESFLAG
jgi:hypothetical protein